MRYLIAAILTALALAAWRRGDYVAGVNRGYEMACGDWR